MASNRFGTAGLSRAVKMMWLLFVISFIGLLFHGEGFNPFVDGWLGVAAQWAPAVVCWLAVRRSRERLALALIALSVTAFAAGNSYYIFVVARNGTLPFPSFADMGYLLFYPFVLGGMILFLHRQPRRRTVSAALDGAVGALGSAAVLAVMLDPLLIPAPDEKPLANAVALAYPLLDLLALAVTAGIMTVVGGNVRHRGSLLLLGLTAFSIADVIYAFRVADDTYYVGTFLDAGWNLGLCLIAAWADASSRGAELIRPQHRTGNLLVSAAALVAAVGVLVVGTQIPVSGLAVGLAGATLLTVGIRTQWAFRQLVALAEAEHQSRTDDLTGLPNRRAFYKDAMNRLDRSPARSHALLLLDVDRFKDINDSLGHDAGDRLLSQIGERLAACLRAEDLIARMGGDEFAVLLGDVSPHEAVRVADKLRDALADPFVLEEIELQTNVSVGIATSPNHGCDLRILMRKADMAMYRAKRSRTGHHLYADDDEHGDKKLETLQELRRAVKQDQWTVHYQPKVDLATGDTAGVEALVRWNHPTRGLLMPAAFLHLVEESGLMNELTNQVLEKALDQLREWRAEHSDLTMAVNLSASAFIDSRLPERITAMMEARDLRPGLLNLEITEDVMMPERGHARDVIARLRASGIQVAIDDFGAGHSSIAYLRDLAIDELKLDRSFVSPVTRDPQAAAVVASIVQLVHSLGLRVVAEGVENRETFELLRTYGCDQGQGYYFSKPLPADQIDHWLRTFAERVSP